MKKLQLREDWPESWKYSYPYDLMEVYGAKTFKGYFYSYQNRMKTTLEMIQKFLPPKTAIEILDIAAAQGNFSIKLAELGYEVTWNDLREDLAGYVEQKREFGKITYKPGNAFELGYANKFDGVLITEIIEHVAHPDEFLNEVSKMVKPGGYIFMTTPLGNYFNNNLPRFSECSDPSIYESMQFQPNSDGHIFLLYEDEIYSLAEKCGLRVEYLKVSSNSLTCGHVKSHYLLNILPEGIVNFMEKITQKMPGKIKLKLHSSVAVAFKKV